MIQATAARGADGNPVLILGLSHENLSRLVADEPIKIRTGQLDLPPMTIIIVAGKTEESIVEMMRPLIGTTTEFRLPGT